MEFNIKDLAKKIDDYFSEEISKTDLGEWANKAYYDILKGSYIEIEKIVIYPFLRILSTFHQKENDKDDVYPCTEENVRTIQDILHGKRDFDFNIEMSIPIQAGTMFKERAYFDLERRNEFLKLRNVIASYLEEKGIFNDEISAEIGNVLGLEYQSEIVLGLLEEPIFKLLRALFKINDVEIGGQKNSKLYAKKTEQNLIAETLLKYLDCYTGDRNFQLLISFKNGRPGIFVVV